MQSVFEARLMTYPEERSENFESEVLSAFRRGYCSHRSVSENEWHLYSYLYAVINAFWSQDIRWKENSLLNAHEAKDTETVMSDILNRLNDLS